MFHGRACHGGHGASLTARSLPLSSEPCLVWAPSRSPSMASNSSLVTELEAEVGRGPEMCPTLSKNSLVDRIERDARTELTDSRKSASAPAVRAAEGASKTRTVDPKRCCSLSWEEVVDLYCHIGWDVRTCELRGGENFGADLGLRRRPEGGQGPPRCRRPSPGPACAQWSRGLGLSLVRASVVNGVVREREGSPDTVIREPKRLARTGQ